MKTVIYTIIGVLIANVIWDLFLMGVCDKIKFKITYNDWLNSKISNLKKKVGREFLHRLFRINRMKGRGRSPSFSEYTESFSQASFSRSVNGERKTVDISIKTENKKRSFEKVCRVEFTPTECVNQEHSLQITTLDSNGEEKEPITLNMSLDERKQFAKKMYGYFVVYHKQ